MLRKLKHQFIADIKGTTNPMRVISIFLKYNACWATVVHAIRLENPYCNIGYGLFQSCIYRLATETKTLSRYHRAILEAFL